MLVQEPYNNNRYTQRIGPTIHNTSPTGETSWAVCPTVEHTNWCTYSNSFLYSYAGPSFNNLDDAQKACLRNKRCNGITQVSVSKFTRILMANTFSLRLKTILKTLYIPTREGRFKMTKSYVLSIN